MYGDDAILILGPSDLGHGGRIELEQPWRGAMPRLRLVSGSTYDEVTIQTTMDFFGRVLALKRPFTVVWDPRPIRWPTVSPSGLRMVNGWIGQHLIAWDTYVQAHCCIITNPVLRSIASLLIRMFAPPQPVGIVRDEAEALEFARGLPTKPRSYVKETYAEVVEPSSSSLFGSWK